MKFAVYVRVSKVDQHPENQLIELRARVAREGWEADYFEESESSRYTRPVKEDVRLKVLRGDYDGVLVWKRDRWARSTSELINDLNAFIDAGRRFVSHTEGLDYGKAQDRLLITILSGFAEFERDIIRERTKLGLARARAQGKKLGRPRKTPPQNPMLAPAEAPQPSKTDVCLGQEGSPLD